MTSSEHPSRPGQAANIARDHSYPDDVQGLQNEIQQDREELSETVDQLLAKTDPTRIVRAAATGLGARLHGAAGAARRLVDRAGRVPVVTAVGGITIGALLFCRYRRRAD